MVVDLYLYYRFLFLLLFSKSALNEPICQGPYSCISTRECAERHIKTGLQEVLFQCARKTKVCCPPVAKTVVLTHPTRPENNENLVNENKKHFNRGTNFLTHRNAYLLPKKPDCGVGNYPNKITEGEEAIFGEYPWMALLGLRDDTYSYNDNSSRYIFICGGTLISNQYILTAAHCTSVDKPEEGFHNRKIELVRLGEHNLSTEKDCNKEGFCLNDPPVDVPIEEIIIHPGWNTTTIKNDIALIRLSKNVSFKGHPNVAPICLPLEPSTLNVTDNTKYAVAGWGKTEWNALTGSEVLRKAAIAGVSLEECNICKEKKKEQYCPITQKQICVQGWKSVDVCKGDSGGPLMLPELNHYQIGITSFKGSEHCGGENIPSIFTNVTDYMPWILDNLSR